MCHHNYYDLCYRTMGVFFCMWSSLSRFFTLSKLSLMQRSRISGEFQRFFFYQSIQKKSIVNRGLNANLLFTYFHCGNRPHNVRNKILALAMNYTPGTHLSVSRNFKTLQRLFLLGRPLFRSMSLFWWIINQKIAICNLYSQLSSF